MRFGLFLPPFGDFAEPQRVVALAQAAEAAGWDGLFLWDHMLAEPGVAIADPWVTMAAVATATSRLRFGALVTPLSRRRPWVLSRQLATLDRLSEGRLVAGIGLGSDRWAEFSAFGEVEGPVARGDILDEALPLLQRLLAGDAVRYRRRFYDVDTSGLLPTPWQTPLPIWGACRWPNRKPLIRIASLQGCFPIFASEGPPPLPEAGDIAAIRAALADLGAAPDIDMVVRCALSLEDASSLPDRLASLAAAGVTWVLEGFELGHPPTEVVEAIAAGGPPSTR